MQNSIRFSLLYFENPLDGCYIPLHFQKMIGRFQKITGSVLIGWVDRSLAPYSIVNSKSSSGYGIKDIINFLKFHVYDTIAQLNKLAFMKLSV
jgi:hypothetical protein